MIALGGAEYYRFMTLIGSARVLFYPSIHQGDVSRKSVNGDMRLFTARLVLFCRQVVMWRRNPVA
jgi:hypothetical protein